MINKIQNALQNSDFDAVLITSDANRRYATDFASTAGICYISKKNACFLTDFRYIENAKKNIKSCECILIDSKTTYTKAINALIEKDNIKNIALEDNSLTYSEFLEYSEKINIECVCVKDFFTQLRAIKTTDEVSKIISAQRIAERAFSEVLNDIKIGISERFIAARLTYLMLKYGGENMSFDPIVVSGTNSSKPHGTPTDKLIEAGDFITMDFGCIYDGYCSDMTRTVAAHHCTDKMHEVYNTVLHAQCSAIKQVKSGIKAKDIDAVARNIITKAGYGEAFGHGFGHGVGIDIHEAPNVSTRNDKPLEIGNIITAEPGIYLPSEFGVRIEDMLLVTKDGSKNLTNMAKELVIL